MSRINGEWKTINGAKVFIKDGESIEQAFEKQKELEKKYSSDDIKTDVKNPDTENNFENGLTSDIKRSKMISSPKTRGFRNKRDKRLHAVHAKEMDFKNVEDYEKAGIEFANSDRGVTHQVGNKFYRFDKNTAEFVAVGKDTNLVTYFKPMNGNLKKQKNIMKVLLIKVEVKNYETIQVSMLRTKNA